MTEIIYKIVPRTEWESAGDFYQGSVHDRRDGFLHFSTAAQLPETLRLHYAGQTDLLLIAVNAKVLNDLRWDHAPARGQDFPHLYSPLPKSAVISVRAIADDAQLRLSFTP